MTNVTFLRKNSLLVTLSVLPLHVGYSNVIRNNQKRRADFFRRKGKLQVLNSRLVV